MIITDSDDQFGSNTDISPAVRRFELQRRIANLQFALFELCFGVDAEADGRTDEMRLNNGREILSQIVEALRRLHEVELECAELVVRWMTDRFQCTDNRCVNGQ